MRKLLPIMLAMMLLSGCMGAGVPRLEDEGIATAQASAETPGPSVQATAEPTAQPADTADRAATAEPAPELTLEEKMASISFVPVSGNYARKCMQQDMEFTEMFVAGKNSFVRMAASDTEEEVFAYNYGTDEFTYLYYFAGELASKVVYDIGEDKVVKDESGLMDILKPDAVELKNYYLELIGEAGITTQNLLDGGF